MVGARNLESIGGHGEIQHNILRLIPEYVTGATEAQRSNLGQKRHMDK